MTPNFHFKTQTRQNKSKNVVLHIFLSQLLVANYQQFNNLKKIIQNLLLTCHVVA